MRKILVVAILVGLSTSSWAVYDTSKLNGWLWQAHVCKNVAIQLSIVAQIEAKYGASEIDKNAGSFKNNIAKTALERETEVKFDQQDVRY